MRVSSCLATKNVRSHLTNNFLSDNNDLQRLSVSRILNNVEREENHDGLAFVIQKNLIDETCRQIRLIEKFEIDKVNTNEIITFDEIGINRLKPVLAKYIKLNHEQLIWNEDRGPVKKELN